MLPIYERYRPQNWGDVLGQPKALRALDAVRQVNGTLAGQVYWLSAPPGTGKTTIARLIMAEVCDPCYLIEVNAADLDTASIREWERQCRYRPLTGQSWGFIVNEAHLLRGAILSRLLTTLEQPEVQRNSTWAFTTTSSGQERLEGFDDAGAFLSRAVKVPVTSQGLCRVFAERAQAIAGELGMNGKPLTAYSKLVERHKNNFRAVLQAIGSGAMMETT